MSSSPETERSPEAKQSTASAPSGERVQEAKQSLASSSEQVKDEAARATSELREQGAEIASTAAEQAGRYATEQKEAGAEHVASLARAVGRAADELESTSPELAGYAHRAASSVGKFSDTLRQRNVRELIDDTTGFAQREPALFFGAAVMVGMALSRFLRSHEEPSSGRHRDGAPTAGTNASGRYS